MNWRETSQIWRYCRAIGDLAAMYSIPAIKVAEYLHLKYQDYVQQCFLGVRQTLFELPWVNEGKQLVLWVGNATCAYPTQQIETQGPIYTVDWIRSNDSVSDCLVTTLGEENYDLLWYAGLTFFLWVNFELFNMIQGLLPFTYYMIRAFLTTSFYHLLGLFIGQREVKYQHSIFFRWAIVWWFANELVLAQLQIGGMGLTKATRLGLFLVIGYVVLHVLVGVLNTFIPINSPVKLKIVQRTTDSTVVVRVDPQRSLATNSIQYYAVLGDNVYNVRMEMSRDEAVMPGSAMIKIREPTDICMVLKTNTETKEDMFVGCATAVKTKLGKAIVTNKHVIDMIPDCDELRIAFAKTQNGKLVS